jgi:hypothetical protein
MCDIPFDRSILQLSNGIRHVKPSTDRKLELTAKASMAQPVSQPAVCSNGLTDRFLAHQLAVNTCPNIWVRCSLCTDALFSRFHEGHL